MNYFLNHIGKSSIKNNVLGLPPIEYFHPFSCRIGPWPPMAPRYNTLRDSVTAVACTINVYDHN
jgi:hypothetical protein